MVLRRRRYTRKTTKIMIVTPKMAPRIGPASQALLPEPGVVVFVGSADGMRVLLVGGAVLVVSVGVDGVVVDSVADNELLTLDGIERAVVIVVTGVDVSPAVV